MKPYESTTLKLSMYFYMQERSSLRQIPASANMLSQMVGWNTLYTSMSLGKQHSRAVAESVYSNWPLHLVLP
jgi:hypothetical protein